MKLGMNLPIMVPGLTRELIFEWCHRIDAGPYSSLGIGERINFPNPEVIVTMSAAAAITDRVELIFSVLALPIHRPVVLAKQLATLDVLSNGRMTVGVGVGGREEDYNAAGAEFHIKRNTRMEEYVNTMRRVWAGEIVVKGALRPVEPYPLQAGGPSILAGAIFPKSISRVALWADGITDFSFGPSLEEIEGKLTLARHAWEQAGRKEPPRFIASFWYALGNDARNQLDTYLNRYLNFLGPELAELIIPTVAITSAKQLLEIKQGLIDLGIDEMIVTPTTSNPDDVNRIADILG